MSKMLKPCPFCGNEVVIVENCSPRLYRPIKNGKYYIACYECEVMMGYDTDYGGQFNTEKEAIDTWNKRI